MTARLTKHLSTSDAEILITFFTRSCSPLFTSYLARILLDRKNDRYPISQVGILVWVKCEYPRTYAVYGARNWSRTETSKRQRAEQGMAVLKELARDTKEKIGVDLT